MLVYTTAEEMRAFSRAQRQRGLSVALVPTMGCLHEGHKSLVRAAKSQADVVIVSIYVNPTQFSVTEDFGRYPRQREADHSILEELQVDATYEPISMYHTASAGTQSSEARSLAGADGRQPGDHETFVQVEHLQRGLCAQSRPHFFRGVATVVIKLFHIVEPDVALFGQKDYQQLQIITRMARDLDMAVHVASVPIEREPDGLAMSSRNKLLSADGRRAALAIHAALQVDLHVGKQTLQVAADFNSHRASSVHLQWAEQAAASSSITQASELQQEIACRIEQAGGLVDYIEVVDPQELLPVAKLDHRPAVILVAAVFSKVRLLDNCELFVRPR